jgi:hypothetical protein
MRSDLVFGAMLHASNRYLLVKLAAKAVRGLHRPGVRIEDTTNDVLVRFSYANPIAEVRAAGQPTVVSIHRKSARRVNPNSPKVVTLIPVSGDSDAVWETARVLRA